jgi:hypothetical protein
MTLIIQDDYLEYKGNTIVAYDSFDGVYIFWDVVQKAINDIPMESLFTLKSNEIKYKDEVVDELLVKGFCLSLMFARNYGFRSNIDLNIYNELWKNYVSNLRMNSYNIYEIGVAVTDDIDSLESAIYEEAVVIDNKKYTMYSSIDWKCVLGFTSDFADGDEELNSEILMALSLLEARNMGLSEGRPR